MKGIKTGRRVCVKGINCKDTVCEGDKNSKEGVCEGQWWAATMENLSVKAMR